MFNFQGTPWCLPLPVSVFISYHFCSRLSRTFLNSFEFLHSNSSVLASGIVLYHALLFLSRTFFTGFFKVLLCSCLHPCFVNFTRQLWQYTTKNGNCQVFLMKKFHFFTTRLLQWYAPSMRDSEKEKRCQTWREHCYVGKGNTETGRESKNRNKIHSGRGRNQIVKDCLSSGKN